MAGSNQSIRTGPDPDSVLDSKKSGMSDNPGPYEAEVIAHVPGTRMGQLKVALIDTAGNRTGGEATVSYASPFYGTTYGTGDQQLPDSPATSGQSYGMWMVPPDIGCKVLVMFINGDRGRGYWFACIYDSPNHHMVPGMGRDIGGSAETLASDSVSPYLSSDSVVPVIEYNTANPGSFAPDGLVNSPRWAHDVQTSKLIVQGLDRDKIRGAISSSSMRETPSNVYGISTPGRKATKTDQIPGLTEGVVYRQGGHQFVMDDGAEDGTDQLIRLRTSSGHQILMNDTEKILYIASSTGAQWIEFSADGAINVYGAAGFNLRSSGAINMHSDAGINMCAPSISLNALGNAQSPLAAISLKSSGTVSASALMSMSFKSLMSMGLSSVGALSVTAGAALSLKAVGKATLAGALLTTVGSKASVIVQAPMLQLNPMGPSPYPDIPKIPIPPLPPIPHILPDTLFIKGKGWVASSTLMSTCGVVPTHEPWKRAGASSSLTAALFGIGGSIGGAVYESAPDTFQAALDAASAGADAAV